MKRSSLVYFALALGLGAVAPAAPLMLDLGDGLGFVRVREVPGDLPTHEVGRAQPRVLDLRFAKGDEAGAQTLENWLKSRAKGKTPIFVLANADSAEALLDVVRKFEPSDSVLTVGIATRRFKPDVAVTGTADNERRAYEALEKGAELKLLLSENPDKIRNDEASLSRERGVEASADAGTDAARKASPPPPLDASLQRAIHVHRAMRALKKI